MKCGNCGSDLPDDSVYCMACGRKVDDEQRGAVNYADLPFGTVIVCPKCGAKNSRTDRWCGSCDAELDGAKKQRASPAPKGPECPKCGASSLAGSSYCRKCGAPFGPVHKDYLLKVNGIPIPNPFGSPHTHEIIREHQVIMIRCKYCGTLNGPKEKHCSSCGAQM